MPPSTQAPDQHQCPRWPPKQHQLPPPTPAGPSLARPRLASPRLASPHLTGAAPPTPASAHRPPTTPLRTQGARAASTSPAQDRAPAFAFSVGRTRVQRFSSQCGHRRLGRRTGGGGEKGGRWMSARAASPSWFPGCARQWQSSCSCSSSREDGGGVGARPDLRVGAARNPGHSGSAGREQR